MNAVNRLGIYSKYNALFTKYNVSMVKPLKSNFFWNTLENVLKSRIIDISVHVMFFMLVQCYTFIAYLLPYFTFNCILFFFSEQCKLQKYAILIKRLLNISRDMIYNISPWIFYQSHGQRTINCIQVQTIFTGKPVFNHIFLVKRSWL